jgi:hypothetical protein
MKKKLLYIKHQNSNPKSTLTLLRKNILTALLTMLLPFVGFSQSHTIIYENFDANNGGWTSSTTAPSTGSWIYNANPIIGEGSYWGINPFNNYSNNANTRLTSPAYSTAGFNNITFYIDIRYKTEADNDGMNIEYTTDANGLIGWTRLGNVGQGNNWYNDDDVDGIGNNIHGWSSQNVETDASPSKFIEASISSTNVTALNNKNVIRFRINFGSDNRNTNSGVAIDNVILKGDFITAQSNPVIGPGSINSNLKLWLKANTGTSTTVNNTSLLNWRDQALDNDGKGYGSFAPQFRNDVVRNINFNPVVDFSRAASNVLKSKGGYWSQDYYIVVKTNTPSDKTTSNSQSLISGRITTNNFSQDGTGLGLGRISSRFNENNLISHMIGSYVPTGVPQATDSYGRAYAPTSPVNTTSENVMILNIKSNSNVTEMYLNGKKIDNHTATTGTSGTGTPLNFSNFNNSVFQLGVGRFTLNGFLANGSLFNTYLDGRMTEVISYSTPRALVDQQKIQSYLAIKNGVTLHAINSVTADDLNDINYIDTFGNTIWNNTANNGFNYDIAGIGRDDNSQLNQKQSRSENLLADISIGLGDLLDINSNNNNVFGGDRRYLLWGSNHGTLNARTPVVLNLSSGITSTPVNTDVNFISIGRTWKVVETGGDVSLVKVSLPQAMLNNTINGTGDFLMFISNTPTFDASAKYRVMRTIGSNVEASYDFNGTKYITFGYAPDKTFERAIKFDGNSNYLDAGNVLNLNSSFTISAWVIRNGTNQTILSKRNGAFNQGYDLKINTAGKAEMTWFNGTKQSIVSSVVIPTGKWHNICVVYDNANTTGKMYIDGFLDATKTLNNVTGAPTLSFLIAAANGCTPTSFFNGTIDEVRIWSVPLTENQLRYVMNQEILSNGLATNGKILPNTITLNEISAVPWTELKAYYPMSTYTFTNAKDASSFNNTAAIKNLNRVNLQTAPLPYESRANGNWETVTTWKNNAVQDIPYSLSIVDKSQTINWNIVKTTHNIVSQGNKTVLGLYVLGTNNKLTATTVGDIQTDGTKIEVSHYLKLDGKIDLVGRSQLIQKLGSDLDITSAGTVERDQQGQSSKYNYNYWSSPVGTVSTTANNTPFTVGGVLRDGTNPAAPALINWIGGFDGAPTTPISLARFWVYKFDNSGNDIANFSRIGETGTLQAGKGFTLKGSGASTTNQNLTFLGKPNNGTITNIVGANQLLLAGNPYPSALDADKFINDNINSIANNNSNPAISGTLYFWEQYNTNPNHVLRDYQGGYAIRNLSGGVAPSSIGVDFISGKGTTSKAAPHQFIAVGQGFFVIGKVGSTGNVIFNNSQRDFHKEDEAGVSQITYKTTSKEKVEDNTHWTDNSNSPLKKDENKKVLLAFNSYQENFHRQALIAFMNEQANSEMNDGYDAYNIDGSPTDMYFLNGQNELAIQGEGFYDENAIYPLGIRKEVAGKISFALDEIKNFEQNQPFFILDKLNNTYHSIVDRIFEVEVPSGKTNDRFFLTFKDDSKPKTEVITVESIDQGPVMVVINKEIKVISQEKMIIKIDVYDILGKKVDSYKKVDALSQVLYSLPKTNNAYIVKITLQNNDVVTKKIVY